MRNVKQLQSTTKSTLKLAQSIPSSTLVSTLQSIGINVTSLNSELSDTDFDRAYSHIIAQYTQLISTQQEDAMIKQPVQDLANHSETSNDVTTDETLPVNQLTEIDQSSVQASDIVISENDKQALVTQTAQSMGIQLLSTELKAVSQNMGIRFSDRSSMLESIRIALREFAVHLTNQEVRTIREGANEIRSIFSNGNQQIANEINDLADDLEASNRDLKSLQETVLSLFAIPQ